MTSLYLHLSGIFNWYHMKYECDREAEADSPEGEPSLTEMTEVAIKMLQKSEKGFFLMVEGGKIDKSHHSGKVSSKMTLFSSVCNQFLFDAKFVPLKQCFSTFWVHDTLVE